MGGSCRTVISGYYVRFGAGSGTRRRVVDRRRLNRHVVFFLRRVAMFVFVFRNACREIRCDVGGGEATS